MKKYIRGLFAFFGIVTGLLVISLFVLIIVDVAKPFQLDDPLEKWVWLTAISGLFGAFICMTLNFLSSIID